MRLLPGKLQMLRLLPDALVLTCGPREAGALYLSFDDGPHPQHTPQLLDLLATHNARASFFLVGKRIERHPALVERIVAEGHTVGNHSYSHPLFHQLTLQQQLHEIERTDRLLASFDPRARHRFRPPRGVISLPLLLHSARQRRNLTYWSYDSLDYQSRRLAELAKRMREQPPADGDVVLMHDDSASAAEVLRHLLPEWRANGRTMHALPALAA